MKKYIFLLFTLFIVIPSCKYDEGPLISIYSKNERIMGNKSFKKVIENGVDVTAQYDRQYIEFSRSGYFAWYFYDISGGLTQSWGGSWQLTNKKTHISMTLYDSDDNEFSWDWEIKRLTYSDMFLERTDENGHTIRWELYQAY